MSSALSSASDSHQGQHSLDGLARSGAAGSRWNLVGAGLSSRFGRFGAQRGSRSPNASSRQGIKHQAGGGIVGRAQLAGDRPPGKDAPRRRRQRSIGPARPIENGDGTPANRRASPSSAAIAAECRRPSARRSGRAEDAAAPPRCRRCSACRAPLRRVDPDARVARHRAAPATRRQRRHAVAVLSGFCGDTSHHTSSRPRRRSACRLIWRWPACAGLNEPPSRPMRRACRAARPDRRTDHGRTVPAPRTMFL